MRGRTNAAWRGALAVVALGVGLARPAAAIVNRPFGSHPMSYAPGSILPNHVSAATLDQAVRDFYDAWKARYLTPACGPGRWVVRASTSAGNLTVSEAHGYGMMLMALMAGHEPAAQAIFDGMFAFFRDHPSVYTPGLMAWNQSKTCRDVQGGDSASDGDLDIAFALLLADRQWGSCGAIDYRAEALALLGAIRTGELDTSGRYVRLGDWTDPTDPSFYDATRSSDWMPDHLHTFAVESGDATWTTVRDRIYTMVDALQATHSPTTGLLPDFVRQPLAAPAPVAPHFLEGPNDGAYDYNACRDPWRLATDWLVNGDGRAHTAVQRMTTWIRGATGGDPNAIRASYQLNGTPSPDSDFLSMAFVAPFGVAAMVDASNQTWLNAVWDRVTTQPIDAEAYYENTLKLLGMIVMSGNWWNPERVGAATCDPGGTPLCTRGGTLFGARIDLGNLGGGPARQFAKASGTLVFPAGVPAGFPLDGGAQLRIDDLGSGATAWFDLTTDTTPIPPSSTVMCDVKRDGWKVTPKTVTYRNGSTAVDPPTCTPGSALGLAQLRYRVRSPRDVELRVSVRRASLAAPVGPLRATLVLGNAAAASTAGACGLSAPMACTAVGAKLRCVGT